MQSGRERSCASSICKLCRCQRQRDTHSRLCVLRCSLQVAHHRVPSRQIQQQYRRQDAALGRRAQKENTTRTAVQRFCPHPAVPRHLIDMLLAGNAIASITSGRTTRPSTPTAFECLQGYIQALQTGSRNQLQAQASCRATCQGQRGSVAAAGGHLRVRMPNQSASSEDFMVAEELFLYNLENLGLMAGCKKWPATGDWYCEAMILLMRGGRVLLRCKVRRSQRGWLLLPRRVQGPHVAAPPHCARPYAGVTLTTCRMPFQRPTAIASIASTRWPMGPSTRSNPMPPASTAPTWPCRSTPRAAQLSSQVYDSVYDLIQSWYHEVLGECHGALVDPDVVNGSRALSIRLWHTRSARHGAPDSAAASGVHVFAECLD